MSRTYLSGNNSRGSIVTGMNATFSHLRGWNAGVWVDFAPEGDTTDTFLVYMTNGSRGDGREVLLGTVRQTPDGPVWTPDPAAEQRL